MVVLTFTGPAVADAEPLALAAAIVARQPGPRVVVAPPLAGIPDRLDQMMRFAQQQRLPAARALAERIAERHTDVARRAAPGAAGELAHVVRTASASLEEHIEAAADRTPVDGIRGALQRLGASLGGAVLAATLREAGVATRTVEASTLEEIAHEIIHAVNGAMVPVVCGGAAAMLTAAAIAAAIGARELQVWTESDGVPAADPAMVPAAHPVPQLSFVEALELARHGVKPLHAGSIQLAASRDMAIVIRNARRPDRPGTVIDGQPARGVDAPAALACRRRAAALQFVSPDTAAPVLTRRLLDLSSDSGEPSFVAATDGPSVVVAFDDPRRAEAMSAGARAFARVTPLDDVALLSVVGEGLAAEPRIAASALEAVQHVTVHASVQHRSGRSFTMLMDDADAPEAMTRVYHRFFPAAAPQRAARGCAS